LSTPPPALAANLQTIDWKISIHERKRAALSDLFQTLLHRLMTAQIRVDKLDINTNEVEVLC
jgi:type I restriction enzyme S subunit